MLLTKLHSPTASSSLVHRPALFEKLNTGLRGKLILVSAPAGFGKSTLISDWIRQEQLPAAWISLDKATYDYYRTLFPIAGDGLFGAANPSNPESNLSNGALGFFGTYTVSRDTLVVKPAPEK